CGCRPPTAPAPAAPSRRQPSTETRARGDRPVRTRRAAAYTATPAPPATTIVATDAARDVGSSQATTTAMMANAAPPASTTRTRRAPRAGRSGPNRPSRARAISPADRRYAAPKAPARAAALSVVGATADATIMATTPNPVPAAEASIGVRGSPTA